MEDDEIVRILGESIIAATGAVRDGKPQMALDMLDVVLAALPTEGLEVVELAALPTKIMALSHLGRRDEARQLLVRMEKVAASHGSTDDLLACGLLRDRIKLGPPDLTARAVAATDAIKAGKPEGVVALEAIANEALQHGHHVVAIGALVFLGKVYAAIEKPDLAHERLTRGRVLLDSSRPFDDDRHATAVDEIDKLLAGLPS